MKHANVAPHQKRYIRRIHSPVVGLMKKIVWEVRHPCEKLTSKKSPNDELKLTVGSVHHDRAQKASRKVDIVNRSRFPSDAHVDGLKFRCNAFLQSLIKSVLLVGVEIIARISCIANIEVLQHLASSRWNVMAFESFGDVGALKSQNIFFGWNLFIFFEVNAEALIAQN